MYDEIVYVFEQVLEVAAMIGLQEHGGAVGSRSGERVSHKALRPGRARRSRGVLFVALVLGAGLAFTEMRDAGASSGLASQQVYVVKPGDTLWSIASRFAGNGNVSALEYKLYSELGTTQLQPGEQVRIP